MPRSKLPVIVLLLAALATAAWLLWPPTDAPPAPRPKDPNPAATTGPTPGDAATTVAEDAPQPAAAEFRTAAPIADESRVADGEALLRIRTVTEAGTIVRSVRIRVQRLRGSRVSRPSAEGMTDAEGRIEFTGIAPGRYYLSTDRRDQQRIDVEAGINEVDFEVEPGVDVAGRVLDPVGHPVAGAEIWLQTARTTWDGARVLGHSDDDGAFLLPDVPPGCSLGAIARGLSPSPLVDLDIVDQSSPPARVDLQLGPGGGELTGRVTDRTGTPIAGAQLAVGKRPRHLEYLGGRFVEAWSLRTVETDENGRYTLIGLPAGSTPLTARATGFGIWRGEATVAPGTTTTFDIELQRAVVVFGTVTDEQGQPEAEVRVSAFDLEPGTSFLAGGQIDFVETFGGLRAMTDDDGNYRLEDITPGTAWMFAQRTGSGRDGVAVALARTTLEVEPGSEVRWDPVIDPGRSIAGIVRYGDGHPIPHLFITLRDERSGAEHVINSGKDGTFRFVCLAASTYEVRVQPPFNAPKGSAPPRRSGIAPDQGLVEIQVDYDKPVEQATGAVSGRIADSGGRITNLKDVTVTLNSDARWFRPGIKIEDGAFRVDDVRPGRFRLALKEGDTVLASTDWHELPPGGDVDVGVLATVPGGSLRILTNRQPKAAAFEPTLYLRRDGAAGSTKVELGRENEVVVASLTPGDYAITAYHSGMVPLKSSATVTAGQTTDVAFDLRAGARLQVAVWWPENHPASKTRGYRFTDASGNVTHEYEGPLSNSPTRPYELNYTLAAGQYRLEFWTDDGLRGELDVTIPANLEAPELRLDLR